MAPKASSALPLPLRAREVDAHPAALLRSKPAYRTSHGALFRGDAGGLLRRLPDAALDLVLDPFAGSNTTGAVAQSLNRRWLAFEIESKYVESSRLRFPELSFPSDG
jgi:site-specific DNA-methyltransferase (cytosine-N4-specific)